MLTHAYHSTSILQQRSYRVNLRTRECENMSFVQKFVPFEVRPNSTYYGSAYIGTASAPDAGVEVDLWGGETQGGQALSFPILQISGKAKSIKTRHVETRSHFSKIVLLFVPSC